MTAQEQRAGKQSEYIVLKLVVGKGWLAGTIQPYAKPEKGCDSNTLARIQSSPTILTKLLEEHGGPVSSFETWTGELRRDVVEHFLRRQRADLINEDADFA
jgi:hypothetical protein